MLRTLASQPSTLLCNNGHGLLIAPYPFDYCDHGSVGNNSQLQPSNAGSNPHAGISTAAQQQHAARSSQLVCIGSLGEDDGDPFGEDEGDPRHDTYVDSSWAVRFSCSGCMVFYHGCLFHWFSKMQKSVSLSSAEAEYFGAMLAARDLIFLRELLLDLGVDLSGPRVMYCDSKSAVGMSFDPVSFKKTKHILRAAEFLRDLVVKQIVTLVHLKGTVMVADLLTKAVSRAVYSSLILLLLHYSRDGVVSPNDSVTETEAQSGGARSGSQE